MSDSLAEVRQHLAAGAALLERLGAADVPAGTAPPRATMGVQIDVAELANLVELAARMGLPPALVFKMALAALEQELARKAPRRMVGAERGLPEGKR